MTKKELAALLRKWADKLDPPLPSPPDDEAGGGPGDGTPPP